MYIKGACQHGVVLNSVSKCAVYVLTSVWNASRLDMLWTQTGYVHNERPMAYTLQY